MGAFAYGLQGFADGMIRREGASGTLKRLTGSTPNTATLTNSPTYTDHDCHVLVRRRLLENRTGELVRTDRQRVWIAANLPSGVEPTTKDKLVVGGTTYSILDVEPVAPGVNPVIAWQAEVQA